MHFSPSPWRTLNRERRVPSPRTSRRKSIKSFEESWRGDGGNHHRPNYWKNSPWRQTVSCRGRWSEPKAIFHWASQLWPRRTPHQTRDIILLMLGRVLFICTCILSAVVSSCGQIPAPASLECIENYFYQPRFPLLCKSGMGKICKFGKNAVLEIKTTNLYSLRSTFRLSRIVVIIRVRLCVRPYQNKHGSAIHLARAVRFRSRSPTSVARIMLSRPPTPALRHLAAERVSECAPANPSVPDATCGPGEAQREGRNSN